MTSPGVGSRRRWIVASLVVVVALGAVVAAAFLLGRPQPAEALAYVPADSALVVEIRRDLPGDQRIHAGNLLAHFPGFRDQSILDAKIDEALGRLARGISGGSVDYARDLRPWAGGPLVLAGRSVADVDARRFVLIATVTTSVDCRAAVGADASRSMAYRDVALTEDAEGRACGIDGRHALFGDDASVRAAIDARRDRRSIAGTTAYDAAVSALPGDHLATAFARGTEGVALLQRLAPFLGSAVGTAAPAWMAIGMRAEDDALVADAVVAPLGSAGAGAGTSGPDAPASGIIPGTSTPIVERAPVLAPSLPADTTVDIEIHGPGALFADALVPLRGVPGVGAQLDSLDGTLAIFGGLRGLVGWVDDAALAVVPDGDRAVAGVLLHASDPAVAGAQVDRLRGLLALAALTGRVTTSDERIDGVQVTLVDLGDAGAILGAAAASLGYPPGSHLRLALAARDGVALVGLDDAFLRHVLPVQAGASLAGDARFRRAFDRAGSVAQAQAYATGSSAMELVRTTFAADRTDWWRTEVGPYAEHVAAVALTISTRGGSLGTRILATVE